MNLQRLIRILRVPDSFPDTDSADVTVVSSAQAARSPEELRRRQLAVLERDVRAGRSHRGMAK